jgi:hypothetical protein
MGFLSARQIRVFDYPRFAEPLRDRVRDRAAELASAAGITIEHIAKKHIRKESQTPDAYILIRGTCGERRAVAPTSACAARPRANSVGLVQRRMAGVPVGDRLERVPSPK